MSHTDSTLTLPPMVLDNRERSITENAMSQDAGGIAAQYSVLGVCETFFYAVSDKKLPKYRFLTTPTECKRSS